MPHPINLVIDRNHIVDYIGGSDPADNFVLKGSVLPDGTDFHSEATPAYSIDFSKYESKGKQAQELLAKVSCPNGDGFRRLNM